ncbi:MAG: hypoxanthine phosphoribosyltransferase [Deltaproteobacteria bacterium]|nr:hypoxanthine phosphoribosyltransferase [Deltaproteobacteria bacterium]
MKTWEKKVLLSRETIQNRVAELGDRISIDYAGKEPLLIGVLKGVVFFLADLMREIRISSELDFIRAASYGSEMTSSGKIKLTKDVEMPLKGKHVIVVEDIVDTGLTLSHIMKILERRGVESLRVCALIDKIERRDVTVPIDYCGFRIKKGFLVGYGLDYNEQYRHLPDIYELTLTLHKI